MIVLFLYVVNKFIFWITNSIAAWIAFTPLSEEIIWTHGSNLYQVRSGESCLLVLLFFSLFKIKGKWIILFLDINSIMLVTPISFFFLFIWNPW